MTLFVLALTFGCALLLGAITLRFIVELITREQYNVSDAPRRVRAIVWMGGNDGPDSAVERRSSVGKPHLLPAGARDNRFARISESDGAVAGRVVEFSHRASRGTAEGGSADNGRGPA